MIFIGWGPDPAFRAVLGGRIADRQNTQWEFSTPTEFIWVSVGYGFGIWWRGSSSTGLPGEEANEMTAVGFGPNCMFQMTFMILRCQVLLWVCLHHRSNHSTWPDLSCALVSRSQPLGNSGCVWWLKPWAHLIRLQLETTGNDCQLYCFEFLQYLVVVSFRQSLCFHLLSFCRARVK